VSRPLTAELIRRIPKAELHCHLDGSVRASTLLELAAELGVTMPEQTPAALEHHMWVKDARHLEDYLARFATTLSVMQSAPALDRISYELAEDAAKDGVRYLEVRYAPVLNVEGGLTLEQAVDAPLAGLARASKDHGIVTRVIICALRHLDPEISLDLARLATAYAGRGVVGFDLAGGESGHPADAHKKAFDHARDHGVHCTCHAGEGDGPDSVRRAVYECGATRIGHGTRLIEDLALTDELAARGVAIEACLTSNVQTRAVPDYASHPLRAYLERGMAVTLNTDNRLMSNTTLVDEYVHAATQLHCSFDELCTLARNGFTSAFLPDAERAALLTRVDAEFATLRDEVAA
jgi:adenosine deaminase